MGLVRTALAGLRAGGRDLLEADRSPRGRLRARAGGQCHRRTRWSPPMAMPTAAGPGHPGALATRANSPLGRASGDAAAAQDQFATLLPMAERVLGPEHPTLAARASLATGPGRRGRCRRGIVRRARWPSASSAERPHLTNRHQPRQLTGCREGRRPGPVPRCFAPAAVFGRTARHPGGQVQPGCGPGARRGRSRRPGPVRHAAPHAAQYGPDHPGTPWPYRARVLDRLCQGRAAARDQFATLLSPEEVLRRYPETLAVWYQLPTDRAGGDETPQGVQATTG
jgi:hypothetical protein